jgi:hypothetical protein
LNSNLPRPVSDSLEEQTGQSSDTKGVRRTFGRPLDQHTLEEFDRVAIKQNTASDHLVVLRDAEPGERNRRIAKQRGHEEKLPRSP